jgi:predicted transcriptional regulator
VGPCPAHPGCRLDGETGRTYQPPRPAARLYFDGRLRVANQERNQHLWGISVQEVMRTDVETIAPDAPIQEAARRMREQKLGCLPVVADQQLVGIMTEYDLLQIIERLEK